MILWYDCESKLFGDIFTSDAIVDFGIGGDDDKYYHLYSYIQFLSMSFVLMAIVRVWN